MLLPLSFVVLIAAVPVDVDPFVSAFVDGLRRDDRRAVRGTRPQRHSLGTSYDRLLLLDDVAIDWYRVHSAEAVERDIFVIVEMAGTATVTNTGERVPWPRWWSLQLEQGPKGEGGPWVMTTAMMLERRLVGQNAHRGPETLAALLREHPELELWPFMWFLTDHAILIGNDACDVALWMLREGQASGRADIESAGTVVLSALALTEPVDVAAAITSAERAVVLADVSGNTELIAEALSTLGTAYQKAGRDDDAVATWRRAATYFDRMPDPRAANAALVMASDLEIARNNFRAALADAELYVTMTRRFASQRDQMMGAFRIAEIHDRLGNIEISRRHYEEARRHARANHDPEWQVITAYKLAMQIEPTDPVEARRLLESERHRFEHVIYPELTVAAFTALATNQREAGDLEDAERSIAGALAVTVKTVPGHVTAAAYVQRSLLRLAEGRYEEALADARLAREKAGNAPAEALTAEGRALRKLGRRDDAEAVLRAAIDLTEHELRQRPLDETGRAVVLKAKLVPHRELLDLLVESGCARDALMIAERMRARSLREVLRRGRVDLSAGLDETKRAHERELEQAIADVNRRLLAASDSASVARLQKERDETRLALRRFRSELRAMHPQLEGRPDSGEQQSDWQPAVAPGELVLELAVNDDDTFLFVLEGNDIAVHRLGIGRDALDRRIGEFVASLEQRDLTYRKPARALYDLILGRAGVRYASAKSLRILPDGPSWRLPFHALIDERGQHLIDRVPIAYSPSLALTRTAPARGRASRTLLAFGDPAIRAETASITRAAYRNVNLGRLPEAAAEARAIARLYGDAKVRTGADARETAFKDDASSYRVLHLAAHSIVDDHAPMYSSIVLAAAGGNPLEDGLLEAREIAALDLRADLAVLSACDTARGAVTAGEGVVGLSWAFLAAGVPTTVVSQWKVGSASTADLMIAFHRELRGGRAIPAALQSAMLALRRESRWQHPFYWAPFVAIQNSGIPSKRQ